MNIDEMKDRIARAEEIQRYTENRCNALEAEIKTLGERCNQLLKDKGDLTDKVKGFERQLSKATEIIKKILYEYQRLCLIKKETIAEVEQFLKKIEK